jgi:hypothetical protein
MSNWKLVVGNLGTVFETKNGYVAQVNFDIYMRLSKRAYGRVSGESVTLFCDDEIHREYHPKPPAPPSEYLLVSMLEDGTKLYWHQPSLAWTINIDRATRMIKPTGHPIVFYSQNVMARVADWELAP